MKRLTLLVLAFALMSASASAAAAEPQCEPKVSCFGLETVSTALSTTQAGAHPDFTVNFEVRQDPSSEPNLFGLHKSYAPIRDVSFDLPPGLTGDPNVLGASQQCTVSGLTTYSTGGGCPNGSQVGVVRISLYDLLTEFTEPLYLMEPPGGDTVARLGFIAGIYPTFVDFTVRSGSDYGLTATVSGTSANGGFVKVKTTTWGVPADPVHDTERMTPYEAFNGATSSPPRPPGSQPLAFMTNPTSCGAGKQVVFNVDSWIEPAVVKDSEAATLPPITGCDKLPFNPSVSVEPTSHRTASPTGLDITFGLPAPDGVEVLESSHLRDIRIDLPPGMTVNPGSADGLGTCNAQQVGLGGNEESHCPDSAKLASTEFDVPSLPRALKGSIYLREPEPGHLLRIWVVADDLGAHIKLPGEIELDPANGQLKSVVLDSPQFPLREVKLNFKSGFRAPLATPQSCGTYRSHWTFTPWSGTGAVSGDAPMQITEGCDTGAFKPKLEAGTISPAAGEHSPFVFTLTTKDGEQNPSKLGIELPPGLSATLAGVPHCEGAAAASGNCPAASKIGVVNVADGFGAYPLAVPQPGKRPTAIYLSGPYKGAPLSAVAVVPAQAGPFDLGDQVVRSAIEVDPSTAAASIESDPLPQIIQGIAVSYRAVSVYLNRPGFMLNPTSCRQMAVGSRVLSSTGAAASPSSRFQAAGCAGLDFKPSLEFTLFGGTHRGAHPALRALVKVPKGNANIGGASVALPHSEFLEQSHIRTVCTRVQFAADNCPPGSIYGTAVAKTPIFEAPLQGPVYLRSSSNPLPDLVAALKGPDSEPVEVELAGRIDSVNAGIRNTFEVVPDAPVTSFALSLQGGKKGLLVNSTNICAKANRATAKFTGQNGKLAVLHPPLVAQACKKAKKHKRAKTHKKGR